MKFGISLVGLNAFFGGMNFHAAVMGEQGQWPYVALAAAGVLIGALLAVSAAKEA